MYIAENPILFSSGSEISTEKALDLYVPTSLADDALLAANGIKPLLRDKYKYFLHTLYLRRVMNRSLTRDNSVEINAKLFEKYVTTRHAANIVAFWIAAGVVETNDSYQAGIRSKSYGLTPAYRAQPAINVGFVEEKFEKKVLRLKAARAAGALDLTLPQNAFLEYNLYELRVDALSAHLAITHESYQAGLVGDTATLDKLNLDTIAIQTIARGKDYLRGWRCKKGNRYHTNLTNLASVRRRHIFIESGEELRNLDVSNSQPLFLCVLLKKHFPREMEQDMLNYIDACETGKLYETMMVEMGLDPSDKVLRKAMKKRLFASVFYGQNVAAPSYREWAVFSLLYPTVAQFITQAKASDYKSLSHRMQKAESALIIDTVIKTIAEQYSPEDFFATTIHDSIVTTKSNAGYVKELMIQAFAALGLRVNVNDEPF